MKTTTGTPCVFHGNGGYELEGKSAMETLEIGKQYMISDVDMPPFGTVTNREAVIFEGSDPQVA